MRGRTIDSRSKIIWAYGVMCNVCLYWRHSIHTCRVSKGMMVSNGDSPIPQRLAAGLNADGAAHGRPSSNSSSSSKVGTVGTGGSCSPLDLLPLSSPPFPSRFSPHASGFWCFHISGCRCAASSPAKPRCVVMASNHSHSSSTQSPRCGRCGR